MIQFIRSKALKTTFIAFILSIWTFGFVHASADAEKEPFDAGRMIVDHIIDAYDWHIASFGNTHISIPLPVILYDEGRWYFFSSSKFNHGHDTYQGFHLAKEGAIKGKVVRENADGSLTRPLDLSITKNVLAVFISSALMIILFINIAKVYDRRRGRAPKGFQAIIELLVLFIRDEVAIPSIGQRQYMRFMPYLLTVFSFIFLNNILGLIPIFPFGANVTGNIAVTGVLAFFTFLLTTVMSNKNYWKHIFNTPGVP